MSRLGSGGRIDRSRSMSFTFNGKHLSGYAGDTLASALLANDVRIVATSVTQHRPRGIFSAGIEEPNALVQAGPEPMLRATQIELIDGLEAVGLNGRGRLSAAPDAGRFDKLYAHCEVLVVGGGRAGLTAALAAARAGDRVIVVDEQAELGGRLLSTGWDDWLADSIGRLSTMPDVRLLTRATAFGLYDQNLVLIAERRPDGGRLHQVRAKRMVLATGAHERPLIFRNNDRPGVMLAGAVRTYLNRYAVAPGRRAVIFTNNDSTQPLAGDLQRAGTALEATVDVRAGEAVVDTLASEDGSLRAVVVAPLTGNGGPRQLECDLLCVSGGFNPTVHLFSQAQGRLRYDEGLACFVPGAPLPTVEVVGAASGDLSGRGQGRIMPTWLVSGERDDWTTHFVDLERDVTVADVRQALGAGMRSIEHVKRFTTIGTGSDQGKTAGINESAIVATQLGQPVSTVGVTTFRPPYVPVSFGLIAGRNRGDLFDPIRVTSIHPWHVAHGARFENVGQWKRPWYFPAKGEDMEAAVLRECRTVREAVGVMDVSTLGKIDLQGPDALKFLNRLYTNAFDTLPIGMCRYGLLCKADGMVFDDGVVIHLGPDHYLATTTSGGAAAVLDWFEEWLQTEWTDLRVRCTSVTEHWAGVAVAGPNARAVVSALFPRVELDTASFPFLAVRDSELNGFPVRLHRITFSGELAYELWTPSWYGLALWESVIEAGEPFGIAPYGTEAMHVLRAEKGYIIVGQETDGTVTPQDLGMSWIVSKKKEFIGKRSHRRADTARPDRRHLVGLFPVDENELLPEGTQLSVESRTDPPVPMIGYVTSSYRSATLGRTFALALVERGRERMGETVFAPLPDRLIAATVTEPIFWDKENRRRDS
ncbi:MAG: 2Fe-2S iron-sulfur cluster-binding protein [Candidatus Dormibacteraeota bacterium]|nr:2Fe-2S iron-sulfur cluster-binding protein [Candidatus Dormibacteraeota bacterium]